jgi:hypothetical protein
MSAEEVYASLKLPANATEVLATLAFNGAIEVASDRNIPAAARTLIVSRALSAIARSDPPRSLVRMVREFESLRQRREAEARQEAESKNG